MKSLFFEKSKSAVYVQTKMHGQKKKKKKKLGLFFLDPPGSCIK